VISWEYVALSVAHMAGIDTPDFDLVDVEGNKVLLLKRFDRADQAEADHGGKPVRQRMEEPYRIGYISAMTLLASDDGRPADYADICLHMSDVSVNYKRDLQELYRRILLSVLINNTDDHLRNHGFLRVGSGWKLSPVFDINPNPQNYAARATSIYGTSGRAAELRALRENCGDFMLGEAAAGAILSEVRDAVKSWRDIARGAGIQRRELEMMSGVLDE
jgi:serine/threonine-protein kinase HipA